MTQSRIAWMTREPDGKAPELIEEAVAGDFASAVEQARAIARQPNFLLGQILESDGRVKATFAGEDWFHYAN